MLSVQVEVGNQPSVILSIPHIEMDAIFWRPNWHESGDNTFFSKLSVEISPFSNWVLDENYSHIEFIRLRSREESEEFLQQIRA